MREGAAHLTGFRGFRPVRVMDPGLGQVTPRIVDLLYRTRAWARVIALVLFLGAAAFFALYGFALSRLDPAAPLVMGAAAGLALLFLVLALPLARFSRAVDRLAPESQGLSVASALEHLGSFWRRSGILVATFLALTISGLLLVMWLGSGELVAMIRDPRGYLEHDAASQKRMSARERATWRGQSPFILKPVGFRRDAPRWNPVTYPPASPGRSFAFEEIGGVCQSADTTFFCLVNFPGEAFRGGSRRIFTGKETAFTLLPRRDGSRDILEVTMERSQTWHLRLAPPAGAPLMKTVYETSRYDTDGQEPLLALSAGSLPCGSKGRFRVVDLAWGASQLPDRLVVDFELDCSQGILASGRLSFQVDS
jgi:hypothetical protein